MGSNWRELDMINKNTFIEKKANNLSISKRKLVFGVGVNDSNYITSGKKDGKTTVCPFYLTWKSMMARCYDEKYQGRMPSYIGCSVVEEWHSFMNFRQWMEKQDWRGKELDKDVLLVGNKIYSPKTCIFVSHSVNGLLNHIKSKKGKLPTGASFNKNRNKYETRCWVNGKYKNLGYFSTPEEASQAYKNAKSNEIKRVANLQPDDKIKQGLIRHADFLINEVAA